MSRTKSNSEDEITLSPMAWMVTFSDLVMLLLTFFVMLLTMSSMDAKKLKEVFVYMKGGSTGVLELSGSKAVTDLAVFVKKYTESENDFIIDQNLLRNLFLPLKKLDKKMEEMIQNFDGLMEIKDDERGIVVSLQENILFNSGEATLKKDVFPILDSIADAVESCPNDILIMGHTDNIPIKSELYESNWELSMYRGLAVLEYFLKQKSITPPRFYVGGYGPSRPLYSNDIPKDRGLNRRVEVIFKHIGGLNGRGKRPD